MMRSWATKVLRALGMTVLAVILLAANQAFPPANNQLVAWSTICTGITNGTYTALSGTPAQCSSSPNVVVTWANVTGAIKTTGCASGNPLPQYSQINACRTNPPAYTQNAIYLNGVAYSGSTCNATCVSGGGSAVAAAPYSVTSPNTVSVSNSTYPVVWSITRTSSSSDNGTCNVTITVGGTTVLPATSIAVGATISGSYTSGLTGSLVFTASDTTQTATGADGNACTITANDVTYYH